MSFIIESFKSNTTVDPAKVDPNTRDFQLIQMFKVHQEDIVTVDVTMLEPWEFQRDTRVTVVDSIVESILVCKAMGTHRHWTD